LSTTRWTWLLRSSVDASEGHDVHFSVGKSLA
jgi:hypothetical protein